MQAVSCAQDRPHRDVSNGQLSSLCMSSLPPSSHLHSGLSKAELEWKALPGKQVGQLVYMSVRL